MATGVWLQKQERAKKATTEQKEDDPAQGEEAKAGDENCPDDFFCDYDPKSKHLYGLTAVIIHQG